VFVLALYKGESELDLDRASHGGNEWRREIERFLMRVWSESDEATKADIVGVEQKFGLEQETRAHRRKSNFRETRKSGHRANRAG
jgi:hypothetical protein